MYLQSVDNMYDLQVGQERHVRPDPPPVGGRSTRRTTSSSSTPQIAFANFDTYEGECKRLLEAAASCCRPTSSA